nr:unnamed protein product [Callosobruchus analis]
MKFLWIVSRVQRQEVCVPFEERRRHSSQKVKTVRSAQTVTEQNRRLTRAPYGTIPKALSRQFSIRDHSATRRNQLTQPRNESPRRYISQQHDISGSKRQLSKLTKNEETQQSSTKKTEAATEQLEPSVNKVALSNRRPKRRYGSKRSSTHDKSESPSKGIKSSNASASESADTMERTEMIPKRRESNSSTLSNVPSIESSEAKFHTDSPAKAAKEAIKEGSTLSTPRDNSSADRSKISKRDVRASDSSGKDNSGTLPGTKSLKDGKSMKKSTSKISPRSDSSKCDTQRSTGSEGRSSKGTSPAKNRSKTQSLKEENITDASSKKRDTHSTSRSLAHLSKNSLPVTSEKGESSTDHLAGKVDSEASKTEQGDDPMKASDKAEDNAKYENAGIMDSDVKEQPEIANHALKDISHASESEDKLYEKPSNDEESDRSSSVQNQPDINSVSDQHLDRSIRKGSGKSPESSSHRTTEHDSKTSVTRDDEQKCSKTTSKAKSDSGTYNTSEEKVQNELIPLSETPSEKQPTYSKEATTQNTDSNPEISQSEVNEEDRTNTLSKERNKEDDKGKCVSISEPSTQISTVSKRTPEEKDRGTPKQRSSTGQSLSEKVHEKSMKPNLEASEYAQSSASKDQQLTDRSSENELQVKNCATLKTETLSPQKGRADGEDNHEDKSSSADKTIHLVKSSEAIQQDTKLCSPSVHSSQSAEDDTNNDGSKADGKHSHQDKGSSADKTIHLDKSFEAIQQDAKLCSQSVHSIESAEDDTNSDGSKADGKHSHEDKSSSADKTVPLDESSKAVQQDTKICTQSVNSSESTNEDTHNVGSKICHGTSSDSSESDEISNVNGKSVLKEETVTEDASNHSGTTMQPEAINQIKNKDDESLPNVKSETVASSSEDKSKSIKENETSRKINKEEPSVEGQKTMAKHSATLHSQTDKLEKQGGGNSSSLKQQSERTSMTEEQDESLKERVSENIKGADPDTNDERVPNVRPEQLYGSISSVTPRSAVEKEHQTWGESDDVKKPSSTEKVDDMVPLISTNVGKSMSNPSTANKDDEGNTTDGERKSTWENSETNQNVNYSKEDAKSLANELSIERENGRAEEKEKLATKNDGRDSIRSGEITKIDDSANTAQSSLINTNEIKKNETDAEHKSKMHDSSSSSQKSSVTVESGDSRQLSNAVNTSLDTSKTDIDDLRTDSTSKKSEVEANDAAEDMTTISLIGREMRDKSTKVKSAEDMSHVSGIMEHDSKCSSSSISSMETKTADIEPNIKSLLENKVEYNVTESTREVASDSNQPTSNTDNTLYKIPVQTKELHGHTYKEQDTNSDSSKSGESKEKKGIPGTEPVKVVDESDTIASALNAEDSEKRVETAKRGGRYMSKDAQSSETDKSKDPISSTDLPDASEASVEKRTASSNQHTSLDALGKADSTGEGRDKNGTMSEKASNVNMNSSESTQAASSTADVELERVSSVGDNSSTHTEIKKHQKARPEVLAISKGEADVVNKDVDSAAKDSGRDLSIDELSPSSINDLNSDNKQQVSYTEANLNTMPKNPKEKIVGRSVGQKESTTSDGVSNSKNRESDDTPRNGQVSQKNYFLPKSRQQDFRDNSVASTSGSSSSSSAGLSKSSSNKEQSVDSGNNSLTTSSSEKEVPSERNQVTETQVKEQQKPSSTQKGVLQRSSKVEKSSSKSLSTSKSSSDNKGDRTRPSVSIEKSGGTEKGVAAVKQRKGSGKSKELSHIDSSKAEVDTSKQSSKEHNKEIVAVDKEINDKAKASIEDELGSVTKNIPPVTTPKNVISGDLTTDSSATVSSSKASKIPIKVNNKDVPRTNGSAKASSTALATNLLSVQNLELQKDESQRMMQKAEDGNAHHPNKNDPDDMSEEDRLILEKLNINVTKDIGESLSKPGDSNYIDADDANLRHGSSSTEGVQTTDIVKKIVGNRKNVKTDTPAENGQGGFQTESVAGGSHSSNDHASEMPIDEPHSKGKNDVSSYKEAEATHVSTDAQMNTQNHSVSKRATTAEHDGGQISMNTRAEQDGKPNAVQLTLQHAGDLSPEVKSYISHFIENEQANVYREHCLCREVRLHDDEESGETGSEKKNQVSNEHSAQSSGTEDVTTTASTSTERDGKVDNHSKLDESVSQAKSDLVGLTLSHKNGLHPDVKSLIGNFIENEQANVYKERCLCKEVRLHDTTEESSLDDQQQLLDTNERKKFLAVVVTSRTRSVVLLATGRKRENINKSSENNEGSSRFDIAKLREELERVQDESRMNTFHNSYNPYKLRQELKQYSGTVSDRNNNTHKAFSAANAVLKIQSMWRGFLLKLMDAEEWYWREVAWFYHKIANGGYNIPKDTEVVGSSDEVSQKDIGEESSSYGKHNGKRRAPVSSQISGSKFGGAESEHTSDQD